AALARRAEVEIRALRLARIAELAEAHFLGLHALGEAQLRELRGGPHLAARIRPDIGAGAQQRVLEAHPQPARAGLAVGHALHVRAEQLSDGGENLFDAVEADAADEMHVHEEAISAWMRSSSGMVSGRRRPKPHSVATEKSLAWRRAVARR